ncbi:ATP-dependent helicase YprA (DUF1998 family)/ribosomal protein S27AE [Arthrobacter sp. UYCu511]|uniref:DEAD/DEAH box helicase n=1 Tax=Arthrobacter sp. UYCu511 TaxID=3156337 RepID=UPI00339898F4
MAELLPTFQAADLHKGLSDYLGTTFALTDNAAREAINSFLADPENGLFKGPYVRLRLPFKQAKEGWRESLDWYQGFEPYGHQSEAFKRLSSKPRHGLVSTGLTDQESSTGGVVRPLPTMVTTGTGSGKTESFLIPIIDHVLRAKRNGVTGMKALILYPMNALANDQAKRLAEMLTSHPQLNGITAGIYTGQKDAPRTMVTAAGLVNDRDVFRADAPDILLTNYKMLDMLLLRNEDAPIWKQSAVSLQYVVLDEFHTYDGAQGTDVAMLLRRLGMTLKSYWPEDLADSPHGLTEADRRRPLGRATPVATSATLGGKGDPAAMLRFAETVFGEPFGSDAVITEARLNAQDWAGLAKVPGTGLSIADVASKAAEINDAIKDAQDAGGGAHNDAVVSVLSEKVFQTKPQDLLDAVRSHPLTAALLEHATDAVALRDLAHKVFADAAPVTDLEKWEALTDFLSHFISLLSHVRAIHGRAALSVEVHMWIRELSRIDRLVHGDSKFRWSDDGFQQDDELYQPALYCRHCGRSGWGVMLGPTGSDLDLDDSKIRLNKMTGNGRFRALMYAPNEADKVELHHADTPDVEGLRWFDAKNRQILSDAPDMQGIDLLEGRILPILMLTGLEADDQSKADTCPACQNVDGISFLGSAVATMLSVTTSNLFGAQGLDANEKKALVFTDSVQDAAHRAGFVQSRSHILTLRAALRTALDGETTLEELVSTAVANAKTPVERYQLIAPDYVDREQFRAFWKTGSAPSDIRKARTRAIARLLFDASLEFGLQSRVGRTLEMTGTVVAEVEAGSAPVLVGLATSAMESVTQQTTFDGAPPNDQDLLRWTRGVLERMRIRGGIAHSWLNSYIKKDGNRWQIWGGRLKTEGMPAFPSGRPAPSFPRIGPTTKTSENLDAVTSTSSWYARWAAQCLGVSNADGAFLAKAILREFEKAGVLSSVATESGAEVFTIPPSRVVLKAPSVQSLAEERNFLQCDTCKALTPGTTTVVDQLDGAPCMFTRCPGNLQRASVDRDYYRNLYSSTDMKRVVAREHTSLLDEKTRLRYETEFKSSSTDPQAPNVLVATPTLEMGIDIGDLSCVMLASLPTSVASYLQRVGRAGRLTGNSLVLAYVRGRGEHLPKLHDPLSVINGEVRPPATYLDAEEILQRQYTAHVVDRFARDDGRPHPRKATAALGSADPGSFLGDLIKDSATNAGEYLAEFLGQYGSLLNATSVAALQRWATPPSSGQASDMAKHLIRAAQLWSKDVEELDLRRKEIDAQLPELEARAESTAATADDMQAPKTAHATLKMLAHQLRELRGDYWIKVLEEYGVLPNYTLLDDSVILDVGVSWRDMDTNAFITESVGYQRGASIALTELAPGATFYAQGLQVKIDAVDLGPQQSHVQKWQMCPQCGWANTTVNTHGTVAACARCGTSSIADVSQIYDVVTLKKVSAEVNRDEAGIGDRNDNRVKELFTVAVAADIDPAHVSDQWYLDGIDFGAKYLRRTEIRWLNLGRAAANAGTRTVAGEEFKTPLFRVCSYCGQLDQNAKENNPHEHRFWCKYRKVSEENVREVALARTLSTQGVALRLPMTAVIGDDFAIPSLTAALLLGLREVLGGAPDHIDIVQINEPQPGGEAAVSLLLHDTVPGGTGYLAEFAEPEKVWALLNAAWQVVRSCSCQNEERLACHNCLLPFAPSWMADKVSRMSAQRLLAEILFSGEVPAEGALEPAYSLWKTTTVEPAVGNDPESHLEQKFRRALMTRLANVGAQTSVTPGIRGDTLVFRLPGGRARWSLTPQEDILGTRPDFTLWSQDPSIPKLAIYTDGHKYHASAEINRLADDAAKRAGLRDAGIIPWAVTWADVDAFASADSGAATRDVPAWYDSSLVQKIQARFSLKPSLLELLNMDAMSQLWSWINSPVVDEWQRFSEVVPMMLMDKPFKSSLESVGERAAAYLLSESQDVVAGTDNCWQYGRGPLVMSAGARSMDAKGFVVSLLLDDRPSAVSLGGHEKAWREWLRLSNLMAFKRTGLTIGTVDLMAASDSPVGEFTLTHPEETFSAEWQELLDMATEDELPLLTALAGIGGLPVPELGLELPDGNMVSIGWEDRKIGVLLEDEDPSAHVAAGWIIALPDASHIAELFKNSEREEIR